MTCEVDVTALENSLGSGRDAGPPSGLPVPSCFGTIVYMAVQSLRRHPDVRAADGPGRVQIALLDGEDVLRQVADADELSLLGLLRALEAIDSAAAAQQDFVALLDCGDGVDLEIAPLPRGAHLCLTVGAVRRRAGLVVVDGTEVPMPRSYVRLGVTLDTSRVSRRAALAFLRDLELRLASDEPHLALAALVRPEIAV